jgi:(1->4)-alpha-D-glucan 1-alpha-D-glucosylmutase
MSPIEIADKLLSQAVAAAAARRPLPESTYRLQFHAGFTFRDALAITPYLSELGITHCYASPYLKARPGSTHGYDIIDHGSFNPEIGTAEEYDEWVNALHEHDLGQILDTVPNHMAVGTNDNPWWNDVLENGPASRYANYFDIAWRSSLRPELSDKVLLPVLADLYGDVLEAGQFSLVYNVAGFSVDYAGRIFPIAPRSYDRILGHSLPELERTLGADDTGFLELHSILTAVRNLPGSSETEPDRVAERQREKEVIKRRLAALATESPPIRTWIDLKIAAFNGTPGDPASFELMDDLLEHQCYRLSYWRVGSDEINYRRFFDINDLAALAIEREEVFEAAHALIFRLMADGKVDGLRIDHPDGLFDPAAYFLRLQHHAILARARQTFEASGDHETVDWKDVEQRIRDRLVATNWSASGPGRSDPPFYVAIEKILGSREQLIPSWAIHGTSGYDFVNQVNGLFVDSTRVERVSRLYREIVPDAIPFSELAYRKKLLIMQVSLSSELHLLTHQLDRLAQKSRRSRDFTFNTLRYALREVIACFPVYRSYVDSTGASPTDRRYVESAVRMARIKNPLLSARVFRFVRDMVLGDSPDLRVEEDRAAQQRFAGKFQQVTAPVMAKGVEDTAFYVDSRLISLNEVGGDPARFGVGTEALHAFNRQQQLTWPFALCPLSTHDTKRSEDVRARINVLSEIPDVWGAAVARFRELNRPYLQQVEDQDAPDPNLEYFLYQTLIGVWPLEPYSADEYSSFVKRVQTYMEKALHEAKVHSSWINPDPDYDKAIQDFVRQILDDKLNDPFLTEFRALQRRVSHYGLFNSQSQTLLKLTSPGAADTYQGTELWDFSLVDPDNRRPVDYRRRQDMIRQIRLSGAPSEDARDLCGELLSTQADGRIKLYIHYKTLNLRKGQPGLFSSGEYTPLSVVGNRAEHVFAFARRSGGTVAIVSVPRLLTRLIPGALQMPLGDSVWQDTRVLLPSEITNVDWRNLFTGERLAASPYDGQRSLPAAAIFADFPVAVLLGRQEA